MSLPKPPPGWLLLLDVGQSQGRIDVPALLAAGVSGLWVRATDGEHDVDPRCEETAASCLREGMPFGFYAVLEPYGLQRAVTQAAHFVSLARGTGATLPPWLDFELARGESASVALASAVAWRDDVEQALGRTPMVYAGPAFLLQLEQLAGVAGAGSAVALARSPLCVAHYTGAVTRPPRVPPPWGDWTCWQASGDGAARLPSGADVDVDYFRGTIEELAAIGCPDLRSTLPTGAPVVDSGAAAT